MKTIQVSLDDNLHTRLKDAAWQAKMTLGNYLRSLLDEHLPEIERTTKGVSND